jgi:hypothetical protein
MGDAFGLIKAHLSEPGEQRQVAVSARALSDDAFDMLAALLSPGVHRIALMPPGTAEQTWLAAEGSWACQEGEEVRQGGTASGPARTRSPAGQAGSKAAP